ncbi:DUF6932 family protein [Agromyces larvae]|uniref:Uncharacterized protein n=1 Tax=Agromyces larvae TaxID=2929802 RepID=A0ABY4C2F4_9MICO|nr:hypothetical protein [Agromyces larvae]UOE45585.1 hypothetical protein MTO99_07490 [Agromyces larvae]
MEESEMIWDDVIDPATGWLVPGRHFAELDEIQDEFGRAEDRARICRALRELLEALKPLIVSGTALISGTFVSRQPGPCEAPMVVVSPHDESTLESWTDAEELRFMHHESLEDVLVGSLGGSYLATLDPLGGAVQVYYSAPSDLDNWEQLIGAVTMSSGTDILGARGVVEVEW